MTTTISKRLVITISVALISMLLVGAFGVSQLNRAQRRFENFQQKVTRGVDVLAGCTAAFYQNRILVFRFATQTDANTRAQLLERISTTVDIMNRSLEKYGSENISDDDDRILLEKDRAALGPFLKGQDQFIELSKSNNLQAALALQEEGASLRAVTVALQQALAAHVKHSIQLGEVLRAENASSYSQALWILVLTICVATLVSGGMGLRLQGAIRRSLRGLQHALENARTNLDLTHQAPVDRPDEIGQAAAAFNDLQSRIRGVIESVRQSASAVAVASRQIASGNTDLSARTEEQAASLEQTASSMTQLTQTVAQNADNAGQANMLATNATELADAGNKSVLAMVETIRKITESSDKISEITGVIEGIAFQTNILALNAAVEAARAGEQGRGFAVVASEVRSLAQRSSTAAKEIKDLIEASAMTVHGGAEQAAEVGATMGRVKLAIKQVSDVVGEIAAASEEQKTGIDRISQAVSLMDEVTQQNAALVEQAAAAAQSLEKQAGSLNDSVAQFKIGEPDSTMARPLSPPSEKVALSAKDGRDVRQKVASEMPSVATPVAKSPSQTDVIIAGREASGDWQEF